MSNSEEAPLRPGEGELPTWLLAAMMLAAAVFTLRGMLSESVASGGGMVDAVPLPAALFMALVDGLTAAIVLVSATGFGRLICRRLLPADAPPMLALATAAAVGLCGLSLAVLVVGTFGPGSLTATVWWPVVSVGVLAALWQAHRPLGTMHLPAKVRGGSLVWVLVAIAAGQWLAGGVLPPGWAGNLTADAADSLQRFMQLPAEYYRAGRVAALSHNVYSHHPLGVEMLSLLAMCLRGGGDEGVVAAKLFHGLFAVIAVLAVFGALRRDDDYRARAAAGLLATAPWVTYLFWPGLVQLMPLCFATLALLWLRHWLAGPSMRAAAVIGLSAGCACWGGYDAAGVVALPVLIVFAAAAVRRRPAHAAAAAAVALLVTAPWAVRNVAATGNPVFPRATELLGTGHWDEASARRWRSANAPQPGPPVPVPPGYQPPDRPSRWQKLLGVVFGPAWAYKAFKKAEFGDDFHPDLGPVTLALLAGALAAMVRRPRGTSQWDWLLLGVLVAQLAGWLLLSGRLAGRGAASCVVPVTLLVAGGLSRLAEVKEIRWLRQKPGAGGAWGLAPATILLAGAALLNVVASWGYFHTRWQVRPLSRPQCPPGTLLVGDTRALAYPPGVRYTSPFDVSTMERCLRRPDVTGEQLAEHLRAEGVTHLFVNWEGIRFLSRRFGWPAEMAPDRLAGLLRGWPIVRPYGAAPASRPASAPPSAPASRPTSAPASRPASRPEAPRAAAILYRVPPPGFLSRPRTRPATAPRP